jgi:hypothetical protein
LDSWKCANANKGQKDKHGGVLRERAKARLNAKGGWRESKVTEEEQFQESVKTDREIIEVGMKIRIEGRRGERERKNERTDVDLVSSGSVVLELLLGVIELVFRKRICINAGYSMERYEINEGRKRTTMSAVRSCRGTCLKWSSTSSSPDRTRLSDTLHALARQGTEAAC